MKTEDRKHINKGNILFSKKNLMTYPKEYKMKLHT